MNKSTRRSPAERSVPAFKTERRNWCTPAQLAEELGKHRKTIYRWIRDGDLPAYTLRGNLLIDRDDLDAVLARRTEPRPRRGGVVA